MVAEPRHFVCWGASGHAKVLVDLLKGTPDRCLAFIDIYRDSKEFLSCPVFADLAAFETWQANLPKVATWHAMLAIGRQGGHRTAAMQELLTIGIHAPVMTSPMACVSKAAQLGDGCQVLPMAVIAAGAVLGRACIVNHGSVVDHECRLGDGVHVAPRATLCGEVQVGEDVFIGAGAVVLPRVTIGARATIGAGATVTRDVPPGCTVWGNPASIHRKKS